MYFSLFSENTSSKETLILILSHSENQTGGVLVDQDVSGGVRLWSLS